ncbi:MAG: hypothetical protein RBS40_06215 [Rhodocyclaceae bacterium]|jgi:4-amino-4-deoxy-L-arabinose transferase-like glycosyltransferase|nr:hypothetical protein [Rhodocyclaceae bacterium]
MNPSPAASRISRFLFSPLGIVCLATVYLLVGLTGHDPWRGDDSRYFGPILSILKDGAWLVPAIAGEPTLDYPPLFFWVGALLAKLTAWLLPLHDGARLASAAAAGATLYFLSRAATDLFGRPALAPASLLTLGTLGLVVHAHETQPILALLACVTASWAGLARLPEAPRAGSLQAGAAAGLAGLAGGLAGLWLTLPVILLCLAAPPQEQSGPARRGLAFGLVATALILAAWLLPLIYLEPALAGRWWRQEWSNWGYLETPGRLLEQLGWFLWPLWPIAGWALWKHRRQLTRFPWRLVLTGTILALAQVMLNNDVPRPPELLPLIPPLALLAAAGVPSLRRGAANAFDWFAVMTFLVFALLVATAWSAMALAWPPGLARQLIKLAPGFRLEVSWTMAALAATLLAGWMILVWRTPRSPNRGPINWATGMTMLWCMAVALLMPWFDHGKSFRPAAQSLAKALRNGPTGCIAGQNLPSGLRASMDYFADLRIEPLKDGGSSCTMLLVSVDRRTPLPQRFQQASAVWEYRRGGGRQLEILRLYRRS